MKNINAVIAAAMADPERRARIEAEMAAGCFEPCPQFRQRLAGDLFTCERCGWWASEHDDDTERHI